MPGKPLDLGNSALNNTQNFFFSGNLPSDEKETENVAKKKTNKMISSSHNALKKSKRVIGKCKVWRQAKDWPIK